MVPEQLVLDVLELYAQIDDRIDAFAQAQGLRCPPGCGRCCHSPAVEATILEVLPIAWHLFDNGIAEQLHEDLGAAERDSLPCLLFQKDERIEGNGRCSQYAHRPFLCRMFGFSSRYDKSGQAVPVLCKVHRAGLPEIGLLPAVIDPDAVQTMPNYRDLHYQLYSMEPGLQNQRYPINEAIRRAIEYLHFHRRGPANAA